MTFLLALRYEPILWRKNLTSEKCVLVVFLEGSSFLFVSFRNTEVIQHYRRAVVCESRFMLAIIFSQYCVMLTFSVINLDPLK